MLVVCTILSSMILASLSALSIDFVEGSFVAKIQTDMIAEENRKIMVTMTNLLPRHCETFMLIASFEFARSQCQTDVPPKICVSTPLRAIGGRGR